jgi:hypothetical protein
MFLEALLYCTNHIEEFYEQNNGITIFMDVLERGNVFHYHFCIEQLSSTISVLRNFQGSTAQIITNGLFNQLKAVLLQLGDLALKSYDDPFNPLLFQDIELLEIPLESFETAFSHRCHLLGLLGVIQDLYFSANISTPAVFDAVSRF